jgi:hypothetical protein
MHAPRSVTWLILASHDPCDKNSFWVRLPLACKYGVAVKRHHQENYGVGSRRNQCGDVIGIVRFATVMKLLTLSVDKAVDNYPQPGSN